MTMKYGDYGAIDLDAPQIKKKKQLTFIDGRSTETVSLMFLELFHWDYMTSIIFAVSHLFSYFWIFLKGKVLIKWLLSLPVFHPPFLSRNAEDLPCSNIKNC